MTRADTATTEIIDTLDSFYCYNVIAAPWADAVINRLEGLAIFLLGDELAEIADRARAAARRLAAGSATSGARSPPTPASCSTAASPWSSPSPTAPTSPRSANTACNG
jgi:hypothetical protein